MARSVVAAMTSALAEIKTSIDHWKHLLSTNAFKRSNRSRRVSKEVTTFDEKPEIRVVMVATSGLALPMNILRVESKSVFALLMIAS